MKGTILGVPIRRTVVCGGLCWGPLIWGNYHSSTCNPASDKDMAFASCLHCALAPELAAASKRFRV